MIIVFKESFGDWFRRAVKEGFFDPPCFTVGSLAIPIINIVVVGIIICGYYEKRKYERRVIENWTGRSIQLFKKI